MISALFKPSSLIGVVALLASSIFLFKIKYNVERVRRELRHVEASIVSAKEDIHILKAEFSYLTAPDVLATLAAKNLNLTAIDPKRIRYSSRSDIAEVFDTGDSK